MNTSEVRKILIPRPWYFKFVNPDGKLPFAAVRAEIVRRAHMYEDLTLRQSTEDQYQLLDALDLYASFYYVRRETSRGKFPFGCLCK